MKRLAVIISVFLLIAIMFGCSVDSIDASSNISEDIVSVEDVTSAVNEESLIESSEEPLAQVSEEESLIESSEEVSSQHQHVFSEATCITPKTCECGATEGDTLNHEWKSATCTKASTCKLCGKTTGEPKGHTYYEGKCTSCGEKDPNHTSEQMVWIPTKGGKKYHSNSACSNMDGPIYVTISEAEQKGFTACKKCY